MKSLPAVFAICLLAFAPVVRADILPPDMKTIYVQAVLTNLNKHPDFVFVKLETLGDEIRSREVIGPDGKFVKGYKFNRLEILAVPKDLFQRKGGLEGLDLRADPAIFRTGDQRIEAGVQLVPRSSPLAGKEVFYRLVMDGGGSVRLEKTGEKTFAEHPNSPPVNLFLAGFLVTFAVEFLVFVILVRFILAGPAPGMGRALGAVLAAQVATLPLLWLIIHRYRLMGTGVILGAEFFAAGVETIIYRFAGRLTWRRALTAALVCNGASYLVGRIL